MAVVAPPPPPPVTAPHPRDKGVVVLGEARSARPRFTGPVIDLELKDADLRDVVSHLATVLSRNVVFDPVVKGSVTMSLRQVPADQALELALGSNGYVAVSEGTVLWVTSREKAIATR